MVKYLYLLLFVFLKLDAIKFLYSFFFLVKSRLFLIKQSIFSSCFIFIFNLIFILVYLFAKIKLILFLFMFVFNKEEKNKSKN